MLHKLRLILFSSFCTYYSVVVKEPTICGVCSKPYNDPRILPCLHSFCQQCLHQEIEKSRSQQVFKCPTCEQNMSIPVGEASAFPQNLHLGFEVELAGYMSKIISNSEVCCDQCIDGSSGPAVVFCCTCREFLCQLCHDHHKCHRQLSKHDMVGLDQEGAKQLQTTMKLNQMISCVLSITFRQRSTVRLVGVLSVHNASLMAQGSQQCSPLLCCQVSSR